MNTMSPGFLKTSLFKLCMYMSTIWNYQIPGHGNMSQEVI